MSDYANCCNQQPPSYSGVTINITNPALNMPGTACVSAIPNVAKNSVNTAQVSADYDNSLPQAYPQQYYLKSYNNSRTFVAPPSIDIQTQNGVNPALNPNPGTENNFRYLPQGTAASQNNTEADTGVSKAIINEINTLQEEQKELEKEGKQTKIVALTNEYIMSLENYLNNPNTDIRLMASKEILTRFDEDRSRYNDAALNALINKMLQDPNKLVRIAAMSALSSELASGNDYTVELLNKIQQNPDSDPQDVLEASQILLKRASSTEVIYTPVNVQKQNGEQQ